MWKAPYRPNNAISQTFPDGVLTVYSVVDTAQPGYKPVQGLTEKITLRYEEQRLGFQRYYTAKQNQVDIERVLRVPRAGNISTQDVAITEDGAQYRIEMIQSVDDAWPQSLDLTLSVIVQRYEVTP